MPGIILAAKAILTGRSIFVRHRVPSCLARQPTVCGGLLLQPSVYHGTRVRFSISPRSINSVCSRLNAARMNGNGPQVRLDPCPNSVADASVLHHTILRPNLKLYNARIEGRSRLLPNASAHRFGRIICCAARRAALRFVCVAIQRNIERTRCLA